MNFEESINEEIKKATLDKEQIRLITLRSIKAAIIEFNKSGIKRDLNKDDELKILNNQAKKRKDAIEMYDKANRSELADKEKAELVIIKEFLPAQLSDNDIIQSIKKVINDVGASGIKDFGKVMGASMKELKGKADGDKVQQFVKELLNAE